ncbi:hypothetical protein BDV97DRAFT_358162 [Delphinella strobiligena]|nr:hypothetical protein BDV97DRAFT_358162 [Delphinella strobiligena]
MSSLRPYHETHSSTNMIVELLVLWHEHRIYVILAAAAAIAIVNTVVSYRSKRTKASLTPLASPKQTATDKKAPLLDVLKEEDEKVALRDADHHVDVSPTPVPARAPSPKTRSGPKRVAGVKRTKSTVPEKSHEPEQIQPLVFFYSLAGATETYANRVAEQLVFPDEKRCLEAEVHNLAESHPSGLPTSYFYLILLPTYNIDTELSNFLDHLQETHNDFRIDTGALSALSGYSVFGFGDREGWPTEEEGFCEQAKMTDKWMAKLTGRKRAFPLGMGDVKSDAVRRLDEWTTGVVDVLKDLAAGNGLGEGVPGSGDAVESDEEDVSDAEDGDETDGQKSKKSKKDDSADLEDLGRSATGETLAVDFTNFGKKGSQSTNPVSTSGPKEMVPKTSPTYTSLTKQGYQIVGSHSGVKICRWTKSALRGRGSCYKFSFYGIRSHLCMETTPSLSCSNKCVFCWRHGTNPVGTTWRWKVDRPELIFDGVKAGHYKKIKMMKGVPGVRAERFAEAMRIRHCALSLVGEPIFYPYINEFLGMLHKERISSFLVCNAQHPEQLAALHHVTQLYVSIDASNKEGLRKIDRPLHRDFWERFQRCLEILREKRHIQRTVFRLTLVKGFNIDDEASGYADLVEKALPGFVEIKGVTYCGTSTSSSAGLTMSNVPFYEEICAFVEALVRELHRRGLDYDIAAEHAHSCCVLVADKQRFYKEDGWHTLIDYERFFECLESEREFGPEDYVGEATPEWAVWGSGNGGFNPEDERVDRKGRKKVDERVKVSGGRIVELA